MIALVSSENPGLHLGFDIEACDHLHAFLVV
jgi:hypothetical protein